MPSGSLETGSRNASLFPLAPKFPITKESLSTKGSRRKPTRYSEGRQDRLEQACRTHVSPPIPKIPMRKDLCENRSPRIPSGPLEARSRNACHQSPDSQSTNNAWIAAKTGRMPKMLSESPKARLRSTYPRLPPICQRCNNERIAAKTRGSRRKKDDAENGSRTAQSALRNASSIPVPKASRTKGGGESQV
jgi:hypothetical protein